MLGHFKINQGYTYMVCMSVLHTNYFSVYNIIACICCLPMSRGFQHARRAQSADCQMLGGAYILASIKTSRIRRCTHDSTRNGNYIHYYK